MKRVLKFLGLGLASLVGFAALALALVAGRVELNRNRTIAFDPHPFSIPNDAASIEEGRRQVQVKACTDCHGADMGGFTFVNEAPVGTFSGSNLTPGRGSRVAGYRDIDWIRAIRYGIGADGRPLIMMPSGDFHGMSNEDLGAMIAYLKTLPPVDRESLTQKVGPVSRVLYSLGQMPLLFPHEHIDLNAEPVEKVLAGETAEYGQYLAQGCVGCHGPGFSGGPIPGVPPSWPHARNLTPSGSFAQWSFADFEKVLTKGITPDGRQINPQFMPWKAMAAMTPTELKALYLFLKTLPARAEGTR